MKLESKNSDSENGIISNQGQLYEYIRSKNLDKLVQLLINNSDTIDINQPDWDESGNAPVIDATLQGQVDFVRVLCENGCNLNARTLRGETALHVAVSQMEFNTEMINLLLSSGCNADIQDNLGRQTALHVFIRKHVVSASSSSSSSSSSSWSSNGEVQEVFQTLAKATNVNIADRRLRTPLHFIASCKKSNIKLLQILLDCEANPNLQNDRGETALHEALENNNETAAEILISRTDLYLGTKYKETPLHVAARKNMKSVVPFLLKHDAPINAQDLYGNTALHLAASKGYNEVVRILIDNQEIQLNISNKEGLTPLHLAVESGFIYTVEVLLKADSCDITARTKRCETALDLAQQDYRRRSQPEMTEVLFREIQRRSCGTPL